MLDESKLDSMIKAVGIILLSLGFSYTTNAQKVKLKKTAIGEQITIDLPVDFIVMTQQDVNSKFISYRQPLAIYTNIDRTVDIGININETSWREGDISLAKDFYQSTIFSLYDQVDFSVEAVQNIEGRDFAVFEFISTLRGAENSITNRAPLVNYTYIQYTIKDGHTYVFNFSCPAYLKDQWQEKAHKIMQSVVMK